MKLLLDECLPTLLSRMLQPHQCVPTAEAGLSGLKNGKLLAAAIEAGFDVFMTVDKSLPHQQNVSKFPIAIVVFRAHGNRLQDLSPLVPQILDVVHTLRPLQ